MSSVVQSTYRPQIAPAVVGMVASEVNYNSVTRICETAAGIPFGVAVSYGTSSKGAVIGGSNFLGVTIRDITMNQIGVGQFTADNTYVAADTYPQYNNMGILTVGDIWVMCHGGGETGIAPGSAVYYDTTTGVFGGSAGLSAFGSTTFSQQPANGDTLVITTGAGVTWTWVNTLTTGNQLLIGPTLGDSIRNAATTLEASADTNTDLLTYAPYPPSPGGSGQGSGANTLIYAAEVPGTAANAYTVVSNTTGATASGISGGAAAGTLISGAFWKTGAIAGQLGIISLGIQR